MPLKPSKHLKITTSLFISSFFWLTACASQPSIAHSQQTLTPPALAISERLAKPVNKQELAGSLTRSPSSSADVLYSALVAEFALQQDNLASGLEIYAHLSANLPSSELAQRTAWLAQFGEDKELALTSAHQWAKLSPTSTEAQGLYAALLLQEGDYMQALDYLLVLDSLGGEPNFTLYTSFLLNEPEEAIQIAYEKLAAAQAEKARLEKEFKQQIKQPAAEKPRKSADIELALASLASYLNQPEAVKRHTQQARKIDSDEFNKHLGQLQQIRARHLYQQAMQAYNIKDLTLMETKLQEILSFAPTNATALNALGYTLVDNTNRLDEGYQYIRQAHRQRPDAPEIQDSLGWALFKLKQPKQALVYLQQAYQQLPEDEVALHLYQVLLELGDTQAAKEVLNQHPNIQQQLDELSTQELPQD